MLTFRFEKGAVIDTEPMVATIHHDVVNAHAIASDVEHDVVNTRTAASEIRCNALKGPKDTRGQEQIVSTVPSFPVTGCHLTLLRLTPGLRPRLKTSFASNIYIQCTRRTNASPAGAWSRS